MSHRTMILRLPPLLSYFVGRRASPMARQAARRGNAAGRHGGTRKYGARERQAVRRDERQAWRERE